MRWMITAVALTFWLLPAMPAIAQQSSRLSPGGHVAKVNGVAFAYFVSGSGPVLIEQSPGWGIGSQYLQHGLTPLEKDFTLVSYDTRASGSSSRPLDESQMTTSNMVDDLEALRRYWGLHNISILGHSHGGAIAIGYAIRYPEHVSKLILVDSSIQGFPGDDIAEREMKAREADPRFATAIAEERSTEEVKTDKEMAESLAREMPLYFSDPGKNMAAFAQGLSQTPSAWVNAKAVYLDSSFNEEHQMHRIRADTLILVGRDDWIAGPTISEKIHAEIPQSQLKFWIRPATSRGRKMPRRTSLQRYRISCGNDRGTGPEAACWTRVQCALPGAPKEKPPAAFAVGGPSSIQEPGSDLLSHRQSRH